jgi:hypothetical protein
LLTVQNDTYNVERKTCEFLWRPKMASKKKPVKKPKPTTAFQAVSKDGSHHIVGIGDLRVVIVPDGDNLWFAQGLEIDYAAQGTSEADVKKKFEYGLEATVNQHIRINGTIEGLLRVAPPEVWKEFLGDPAGKKKIYSQITSHVLQEQLPFEGIKYLVAAKAA